MISQPRQTIRQKFEVLRDHCNVISQKRWGWGNRSPLGYDGLETWRVTRGGTVQPRGDRSGRYRTIVIFDHYRGRRHRCSSKSRVLVRIRRRQTATLDIVQSGKRRRFAERHVGQVAVSRRIHTENQAQKIDMHARVITTHKTTNPVGKGEPVDCKGEPEAPECERRGG